jgi:Kef-type K+ transport system membrane component KefB/predicted amino acid-binding ACT domain protein
MDITSVLTDILVVLVAAKLAAEIAERIGIPAVVGEIVAGVLVGPSVLNLVGGHDDVLHTLGEIGVILLLFEVGMEMDLAELGKVGKASFLVACVGVITPMILGLGAVAALGEDMEVALFIGAALTATSVGITARVFGDLRALATTEARIVLGAAVADDVMGLVVLTVVVRIVTEGSVSVLSVLGIIGVALAFLVVSTVVGLRISAPLFRFVNRFSRSTGTLVALALAFTLAFARLAGTAKLAPIIGAFVAGIALSKSDQSDRIRRELTPVGHLFIPVFFLQIGINADVGAFADVSVLGVAAVLLAVAIVGKLVSPLGAIGSPGDKLLIGIGMLPRGEVGLIFATIGLANGVLDQDLYASLLLVVLVTTLATPQLLKWRFAKLGDAQALDDGEADVEPAGGWLAVEDGVVDLAARPPSTEALPLALRAALVVRQLEPGRQLLEWLTAVLRAPVDWRPDLLDELLDVVERGNARSWRFLGSVGFLDAAIPELAGALRARSDDPFMIDQLAAYRLGGLERRRVLDAGDPVSLEADRVEERDDLLLALLLAEGLDAEPDAVAVARAITERLALDAETRTAVTAIVADRDLLWAAALRAGGLGEEAVLQLASHLETPERARLLYVVTVLLGADRERWQLDRLRTLYERIQQALSQFDLTGSDVRSLIELRRDEAIAVVHDDRVADVVRTAPRSYILRVAPPVIARHAALVRPPLREREVRVLLMPDDGGGWTLDVATRDRHGLLASVTGVLARHRADVRAAVVATWDSGAALECFELTTVVPPDPAAIEREVAAALGEPLASEPVPDATVTFDQAASPWHTVCEVSAADRPGLVHQIATAFAAAGVEVVAASIGAVDGVADDRFELVDRNGRKLSAAHREAVRQYVLGGVVEQRRFGRSRYRVALEEVVAAGR